MTLRPAVSAFVLLASCVAVEPFDDEVSHEFSHDAQETLSAAPPIPEDPHLEVARSEMLDRWIASIATPGGDCPEPDRPSEWFVDHLFARPNQPASAVPPGLARYCVYNRDLQVVSTQLEPILQPPIDVSILPDLAIFTGSAGLDEIAGPALESAFLENAGYYRPLPMNPNGPVPRLAFLDSTPTVPAGGFPWDIVGTSDHGWVLTNIGRELLCEDEHTCAAEITTRLALTFRYDRQLGMVIEDEVNGGDLGSITRVALAIHDEVTAWTDDPFAGPLILNLSIAWQPEFGGAGGPQDPTWPPAMHAIYAALVDAQCRGALILAAVGNQTGGPRGTFGPMYPAGWSNHQVTMSQCEEALFDQLPSFDTSANQPLLYAIGAVDSEWNDLKTARRRGRPPVLAIGDHAVVPTNIGPSTPAKSGTSISTVVASSAAALMWANRPSWSAHKLMDELYGSGKRIERASRPWCPAGPGSCPFAVIINACHATKYACTIADQPLGPGDACFTVPSCPITGPVLPHFDPIALDDYDAAIVPWAPLWGLPRQHPVCGPNTDLYHHTTGIAPNPCPWEQYYSGTVEPWTTPQPEDTPCPYCQLDLIKMKLRLYDADGFADVSEMALEIQTPTGTHQTWSLPTVPLGTGGSYNVPAAMAGQVKTAGLTMIIDAKPYQVPLTVIE